MTVKELIDELLDMPQDATVLLSKDEEGNDFKHLWTVAKEKTLFDGNDIEVMHIDDFNELDDDDKKLVAETVVLWP